MSNKCPTCGRSRPKRINPVNRARKAKRMEETFGPQARMCSRKAAAK